MDRFERMFQLNRILKAARAPVPRRRLEEELECSRATVKRLVEEMRLYLNAPIVYDRRYNGYRYDPAASDMYELPGLWFNASELHALLSVQQLLADVQPGLLEGLLRPLQKRIEELLTLQRTGSEGLLGRIRILQIGTRQGGAHFQTLAGALAQRRRLELLYYTRGDGRRDLRAVSPQRLVHYRDNWYLDGWCHLREGLRTFAVDAIEQARVLDDPALEVPEAGLDAHFASAYGIFAGAATAEALLRFCPERARYVARERWHPDQQGEWLADGCWQLRLPYSNPAELLMDILKYGPDVEVLAPAGLRAAVAERLARAAAIYQRSPGEEADHDPA